MAEIIAGFAYGVALSAAGRRVRVALDTQAVMLWLRRSQLNNWGM